MRSAEESRKRWGSFITDNTTSSSLREQLKTSAKPNPCEDGLRSVCWKVFLLFDNLPQSQWPKALADSRSAFTSLREHFLRYTNFPDDLESTVDPLAEDENSPWQSLREDEQIRAEIFQDVERCLQDNFFFREPSTQQTLLDILFIYSKLNQDIGYRQGMHEILAPVLWVVERDAIKRADGDALDGGVYDDFMSQMLDSRFIDHDAFTIFCVIMQTAKAFYEVGDHTHPSISDTSSIMIRSRRIHNDLLGVVDPQLASHLQAIEILPQIFVIRWIRLLFGREFPFDDVLSLWDVLFVERLSLDIIDLICVSMLLRVRWQLMDADYSSALTLLLKYPEPQHPNGPETLVLDALYLQANLTRGGGSSLISKYSGRAPIVKVGEQPYVSKDKKTKERQSSHRRSPSQHSRDHSSSGGSPARFLQQQRGLENLFQEVSGGLQRRSEAWGVTKAVRGAVSEVRKNVQGLQSGGNSPRPSMDIARPAINALPQSSPGLKDLTARIKVLEERNKALAKMLGTALDTLRSSEGKPDSTDQLTEAVARIQFVQVYLEDPSIDIPQDDAAPKESNLSEKKEARDKVRTPKPSIQDPPNPDREHVPPLQKQKNQPPATPDRPSRSLHPPASQHPFQNPRPTLAQSSFSWMLGEDNTRRSSFVTPSLLAPDERRNSDPKARPAHLFGDSKPDEGKRGPGIDSEDDGFTMNSLRASKG